MVKMLCSLCRNERNARPLDMEDPLFGSYVKLMRRLKLSRHSGSIGVCEACMPAYRKMQAAYLQKITLYGVLGLGFAAAYFYLTGSIMPSLIIGLFVFSLSLLHYCPPLKE